MQRECRVKGEMCEKCGVCVKAIEINVCLPSDKGTEFCVIQQDTYTLVALDHLNDANTYQKVSRMSAKTVDNKVNTVWSKDLPTK